ncbi:MAG: MoaD/ThiS family protein [bacterium]|nr:MoaD/ThiS family protein [bacterium]
MRITIKMMGQLRSLQSEGQSTVVLDLSPGSTVADAIRTAGVPDGEPWNASVAGQLVYAEHPLEEGDSLLVFAPIAGGCKSL